MARSLLVGFLLWSCVVQAFGVSLRGTETRVTLAVFQSHGENRSYISQLKNIDDRQFTLDIDVGGQALRVAPDTGSFTLVVSSKRCLEHECPVRAFEPSSSRSYEALAMEKNVTYASGQIDLKAARDTLSFAGVTRDHALFWEITKVGQNMQDYWSDAVVDGILGLAWQQHVPDTVENASEPGGEPTVLESVGILEFTVCLGRVGMTTKIGGRSGAKLEKLPHSSEVESLSLIQWGPSSIANGPIYVNVIGDLHWAVPLSQVSMKHRGGKQLDIGCFNAPCKAVVDTGSSAILAPFAFIQKLREAVGDDTFGTRCPDDWSKLPDLHFRLGGVTVEDPGLFIVIPPEAYFEHWRYRYEGGEVRSEVCKLRIVGREVISGGEQVWVLGVPFLQEYAAVFDRSRTPPRIGVAPHPGDCSRAAGQEAAASLLTLHRPARGVEGLHDAEFSVGMPESDRELPDPFSLLGLG